MEGFNGKWNLVNTEGFDEYMKALGVGMVMRKMGNTLKPTQDIAVEGDNITLKTISTFKTTEIKFKLGEEFDETTADGRNVKTTVSFTDGKLIQAQKGDPDSTLTRELQGDNTMVMTLEAAGVTAKRTYNKA